MKRISKAEPRFDIDLAYGRQAELQLGEFLDWIAQGNGRVEVKRKRIADLELYVEEYCDKGRTGHYEPSGILVTAAHAWAFTVSESGISMLIPTPLLVASLSHRSVRYASCTKGTCPTRGKLVNLRAIFDTYNRLKAKAEQATDVRSAGGDAAAYGREAR
jgi:hypothetical protein